MAGSLNKVILIGNLGRDPEVRMTQDKEKIITLSIATSEKWKDRVTQERRERTEWHRVVVFQPRLCEICEKYLHKGDKVCVEGQLQTRQWVDQQNRTCRTQEIVIRMRGEILLLDSKSGGAPSAAAPSEYADEALDVALNDEIPF